MKRATVTLQIQFDLTEKVTDNDKLNALNHIHTINTVLQNSGLESQPQLLVSGKMFDKIEIDDSNSDEDICPECLQDREFDCECMSYHANGAF